MNTPEADLLDCLHPGEMLRFVLKKNVDDAIVCSVEGAPGDQDHRGFANRLAFHLRRQRRCGYVFSEAAISADTPEARNWLEIRPQSQRLPIRQSSGMGFGIGHTSESSQSAFCCVPLFPGRLPDIGEDELIRVLRDTPVLHRVEVEYTRLELNDDQLRLLRLALADRQSMDRGSVDSDVKGEPIAGFLGLWLQRGTGWRVVLRVTLDGSPAIPDVALEHLGRCCFRCSCEITDRHALWEQVVETTSVIDLASTVPERWVLPTLLPRAAERDALSAAALLNTDVPRLPRTGMRVGEVEGRQVLLPLESRDRHTYIVGGTGTGKSTLLFRMVREDMIRGEGVILLDPHGDLYNEVLEAVPAERRDDLVQIDPLNLGECPGINFLDIPGGPLRHRHTQLLVGDLLGCFQRIWGNNEDAFGPMFESYFRGAIELMVYGTSQATTLADFERVFFDADFRKGLLKDCTESATRDFWTGIAQKAGGEASLPNVAPYVTSKLGPILRGPFLSKLFCAPRDELNLTERINRKPVLLVNLNKGILGDNESRVLGVLILSKIMAAAVSRSLLPPGKRTPVNLYADEFQNFASDSVGCMVSEARKFGLRLTLANQNLSQLRTGQTTDRLLETLLGNIGNLLFFRLGVADTARLEGYLEPYSQQNLQRLPNFHCLCRLLTVEGPIRPFIMKTLLGDSGLSQ